VGGQVIKGPTEPFLEWAGHPRNAQGIAAAYRGVIAGLVSDERTAEVPILQTDVLMANAQARRRLAGETLDFARALAG
jgi:LPPG:FO 2-phospho-L-lactate transferase